MRACIYDTFENGEVYDDVAVLAMYTKEGDYLTTIVDTQTQIIFNVDRVEENLSTFKNSETGEYEKDQLILKVFV